MKISYQPQGVTNVLHADFEPVAKDASIPVEILEGNMGNPVLLERVRSWQPALMVVVGWYHMIPRSMRTLAPAVGLHASLLPDYSGGAPLVWAIINGEKETGITLFQLDDGFDTGPIIGQRREPIFDNDTIATLYARIEERGLDLLRTHLPQIARGEAHYTPQDESRRRIFPQRSPEDGRIDWSWSARRVYNFVRAPTRPYPGAFTELAGERLTGC
jgi:methionyl-tRNA formyltransferase